MEETLATTFQQLRPVLARHADDLQVKNDDEGSYYLEHPAPPGGRAEMFGAVMVKKNYVSFHYLPVYADPGLLDGVGPELRRRMQGKSCFNFRQPDDPAIEELRALVDRTAGDAIAARGAATHD